MARIEDLGDYEKHFFDVMKARGYKHAIMTDTYSTDSKGVQLTHPDGIFRFEVAGNSFYIQTPKQEMRGYSNRKKEITKWHTLRNLFTDEEHKAMQAARIVPGLDDGQLVARIEATVKANSEEESMRGIRQARRTALREAAPVMWRALSLITSDKVDRELLEDADPMALKQCLEALAEAGDQDPDDLSVSRYSHAGG